MYICNKIHLILLLGLLNLAVTKACRTIGGPDPYQRCIFPFIWNGLKYYGCPVDPDNNAVRWCSTAVDRYGYHVIGQGRYGYCDNSCPDHKPPDNNDTPTLPSNETCISNNSRGLATGIPISVFLAFGIQLNILQRLIE